MPTPTVSDETQDAVDAYAGLPTGHLADKEAESTEIYLGSLGLWLEVRTRYLSWVDGRLAQMVIATDITARRNAEEQAQVQAERAQNASRLITMGEMASSVAHELNQPLTAIVTNAQAALRFLLRENPDFLEVEGALREIAKDGKRSGAIMYRLRDLLKKSEIDQAPLDLNAVALEVLALVQAEFTQAGVTLKHELTRDLPWVKGDRVQLEQVVLNLLANALDAARSQSESPPMVHLSTWSGGGGEVHLQVRDVGSGLSPEILNRLFEPFFTTKAKGMGMGLAVSKSIIEVHGGRIWAEPNQDRGAAFHISLPAAGEPAP